MTTSPIPVTILTGFLGSGKTTLLNRILSEQHGGRVAVIENEFGEAGIDNELLLHDNSEQIVEMNNGCICCTVRGDLVRILGELRERRDAGGIAFERVIIETTGLADPAPVAQTFFADADIHRHYVLDAIITVVDAVHGPLQLDEHHEAQEQVGFADRILISKTDLATEEALASLESRLRSMNPRAPLRRADFGRAAISELLDIRGFDLDAILAIDPGFLDDTAHDHDDEISSFVYRDSRPFDLSRLELFMDLLIQHFGTKMLRYKGVLHVEGRDCRTVFQGVHMLFGADMGRPWLPDEPRESVMVFIGRSLPREVFEKGLALCVAGAEAPAETVLS